MLEYIRAFHIISMVCWFAGIFYLPRLFVYHAMSDDQTSQERFAIMERKLYRGIMTPSMIATWGFGLGMIALAPSVYLPQGWLHIKLALVILLTIYHLACGRFRLRLANEPQYKSHVYWRWFNEIPVIILISVVILAVVKPF
ncbi:protoporphyrinogen oxidase HemJ [Moraxella sp. FZLJ2107]|uniref:protoporphyrinogen oxidase HemJ n=1 Tax=unclassified Moraxella TaxID=2685852 RepID=UPI0020C8C796|nr:MULTISPECIES: protoporphyrinogen oxidase HemJ [unclassified Moraxella]UTO06074.1 protoporphyrinogen oxidase HemJ [Moraxella sp. FZLJ2107]UTO22811.1 protoporphyrinogen oxidase HemJ [Moraxella sp. FZLJ2109]